MMIWGYTKCIYKLSSKCMATLLHTIILPPRIHNINDLPAIRSFHQLKNIHSTMTEFIAKVKFIGRPNAGQVAINFYSIKHNAFIIHRHMCGAPIAFTKPSAFSVLSMAFLKTILMLAVLPLLMRMIY